MEPKHGSVGDLVHKNLYKSDQSSARPLLHQTLQALDYLAYRCIIHRNVKPENILYTCSPPGYEYQLADFGLSNAVTDAQSQVGSTPYMAPELDTTGEQTPKMDVGSLFVTLAYAMDVDQFQSKRLTTTSLRIMAVQEALSVDTLHQLREMAVVNPTKRASAADMLDKLFGGKGRTHS